MCLFDADQSCSRHFLTALLPYIDSGDNVAVALSPQLMFNVRPDVDIFNHQNVHFWEKMQPGMDALGFISLTGALIPPVDLAYMRIFLALCSPCKRLYVPVCFN